MSQLRVGLVGLGMMGRHHARVLREIDGLELVALADALGDAHGVAGGIRVCGSVSEMIDVGIDMAVAAVPTALHEEVAIELAEANIHTLIEKPIASNGPSGQRIMDAFALRKLVGGVGHIERYNPALISLRQRIESGELGEVYQIATRRQGPFPARISDVGVIKDLATHDIDLTAWLAQSPYRSIYARITTRSGRDHEDMVSITGQLANEVITNHLVNWLSPMKERLTVVTGEKGAFVADTLSADLSFFKNGTVTTEWESVAAFRGVSEGPMIRYALAKREPLRAEHEAFRDAVLGKSDNIVSMQDGLATIRVAEAALASASTGDPMNLGD